jgi:hypothetical protein
MNGWVATEIVMAKDEKTRLTTLIHFLEVLEHLRELQNYHGLMVVYSALNLGCVRLFEHTWKEVPSKALLAFKTAEQLLSPVGNYAKYRATVKSSRLPLLPFQGT